MSWEQFKQQAPQLAETAESLFEKSGVILLGTIRRDGSPRISPVEPIILDGQLYLGMMWHSFKALDLLRDPRCTVHSSVADRLAPDGEFKLHGRAIDVQDQKIRSRYGKALYEKIGWNPEESGDTEEASPKYHLFSIDIFSAAFLNTEGDARKVLRWRLGESVEEFIQTA